MMYDPGASVRVASAVTPFDASLGPPTSTAQEGIGPFVHDSIAFSKSTSVFPSRSCTSQRWCTSLPAFSRRNVIVPAGIVDGASNLKSVAFTVTTEGAMRAGSLELGGENVTAVDARNRLLNMATLRISYSWAAIGTTRLSRPR